MVRFLSTAVLGVLLGGPIAGCCCQMPAVKNKTPGGGEAPGAAKSAEYVFYVNTGKLMLGEQVVGTGFSGKGDAKNDADSAEEPVNGVIPPYCYYTVENRRTDAGGEPIFDLKLWTGSPMKGRTEEKYTLHADTSPDAGASGIAMPRAVRDSIQVPTLGRILIHVKEDPSVPPRSRTYTYSQSTGQFKSENAVIAAGYSGKGKGRNNPASERTPDGPIPAGTYTVNGKFTNPVTFPEGPRFKLNAAADPTGRGKFEEFWIAAESIPPGMHPASYIVVPGDALVRIRYRHGVKVEVKVVP
jgi:hypothetical protein